LIAETTPPVPPPVVTPLPLPPLPLLLFVLSASRRDFTSGTNTWL
jgi:hypothetical protein